MLGPRVLPLLSLVFLLSCENQLGVSGLSSITVTEHGSDEINRFCRSFNLAEDQVKFFFLNAHAITQRQLHDKYSHLPCYVRGKANRSGSLCTW